MDEIEQPQQEVTPPSATSIPNQSVNVVVNQAVGQTAGGQGTLVRNHLVAILLAVLLGWLGIDRF